MRRVVFVLLLTACTILVIAAIPHLHFHWKIRPHLLELSTVPFDPASDIMGPWDGLPPGHAYLCVQGHKGYAIADIGCVRLAQIDPDIKEVRSFYGSIPIRKGAYGRGSTSNHLQGKKVFSYRFEGESGVGVFGELGFGVEEGVIVMGERKVELVKEMVVLVGEEGEVLYLGER